MCQSELSLGVASQIGIGITCPSRQLVQFRVKVFNGFKLKLISLRESHRIGEHIGCITYSNC